MNPKTSYNAKGWHVALAVLAANFVFYAPLIWMIKTRCLDCNVFIRFLLDHVAMWIFMFLGGLGALSFFNANPLTTPDEASKRVAERNPLITPVAIIVLIGECALFILLIRLVAVAIR